MTLTAFEMDAMTELFNIGLHRAAASLSELTHQRVLVDLPRLWVCPISELKQRVQGLVGGDLATVHQIFRGPMSGDAVLMLEYDRAALLTSVLTAAEIPQVVLLDQSSREVLAEVGNIVLSSCLSAFGNILEVAVTFSVPRIHIESVEGMLRSLSVDTEEVQYALIAATRFRLSEHEVGGYLIIVIGVSSLTRVTHALTSKLDA